MTQPKYDGPERRNSQTFRIPAVLLITAMVLGLLGLASWALDLERRKVDVVTFQTLQNDLKDIQRDVKELLKRDGRGRW